MHTLPHPPLPLTPQRPQVSRTIGHIHAMLAIVIDEEGKGLNMSFWRVCHRQKSSVLSSPWRLALNVTPFHIRKKADIFWV